MAKLYLAVYRGETIKHWPKFPRVENIQTAFDEMYLSPSELSFIGRIKARLARMKATIAIWRDGQKRLGR